MKKLNYMKIAGLIFINLLSSGLLIQRQSFCQSIPSDVIAPSGNISELLPLSDKKALPFSTIEPTFFVNAGNDGILCIDDYVYELSGTCTYPSQVLWVSGGDGIFTDPTNLQSAYLPGFYDFLSGKVTLYLYLNNFCNECPAVYDELTISIVDCTYLIPGQLD